MIQTQTLPALSTPQEIAMVGYPDDKGVELNRGRKGAALGPASIRRELYKMTLPADGSWDKRLRVWDLGDIAPSKELKQTHLSAQALTTLAAISGRTVVCLGGGHDFAAPTFLAHHSTAPKKRWGVINIDPHLDARELEGDCPHSGSAFRALIESGTLKGNRLVQFGTRLNRNTASSWKFCLDEGVAILPLETLRQKSAIEKTFCVPWLSWKRAVTASALLSIWTRATRPKAAAPHPYWDSRHGSRFN